MDKKLKKGVNNKAIILLVVAIVLFVATIIRITFAWYTDKKSYKGELAFGNVELNVTDGVVEETKTLNYSIIRDGETLNSGKVYPGDKVRVNINVSVTENSDPVYYIMALTDSRKMFENACYFKDGSDIYVLNDSGTYLNTNRTSQVTTKYVGKINSSTETHEITIDNEILNIDLLNEENNSTKLSCNIYAIQQANLTEQQAQTQLLSKIGIIGDYTQADYIESTGAQYIDTGVNISPTVTDWNVEMSTMWTDTSTRQLMGYNAGAGGYFGVSNSTNYEIGGTKLSVTPSTTSYDTIKWGLSNSKYTLSVNGIEKERTKDATAGNIFLFNLTNNLSYGYACKAKMEYCKITVNGEIVRNFVPVVRNSDGKPGMYDLVTKRFYTNGASGVDFTCHGGGVTVFGNSTQNGTPSTTSPKTLTCVGALITSSNASSFGADSPKVGKYAVSAGNNNYIFINEPLRSVKNNKGQVIADELDLKTKTVTRRVASFKILGTNDFTYSGTSTNNKSTYGIIIYNPSKFGNYVKGDNWEDIGDKIFRGDYGACSHFSFATAGYGDSDNEGFDIAFSSSPHYVALRRKTDDKTVAGFKTWLQEENSKGTPVELLLAKYTPEKEQY